MPKKLSKRNNILNQFCTMEDRAFKCKEAYGCGVACPFNRFWKSYQIMKQQGVDIGQAWKLAVRDTIPKKVKKEILRQVICGDKKDYPADFWKWAEAVLKDEKK